MINFSQKLPFYLVGLTLIMVFSLMIFSSLKESATMDELAHIPAGYSYLKFGDNHLNPEHPPLLKNLAAFPLLFLKLNFPLDSPSWQIYVNGQWDVGREFLYESGNNADLIIQLSRLGPMFLTLLTCLFLYLFAKKLMGPAWAFLPFFLFSFSPLVLAHGHYVTTDLAATFGSLIAIFTFINYLKNQTRKNLILAGLTFGISQLLKFSLAILLPFLFVIAIIFYKISTYQKIKILSEQFSWKKLLKFFIRILSVFLIGYILVFLVYLPQNINYPKEKQKSDTEFILHSFAGGPDPSWKTCYSWTGSLIRQFRCLANINIWLADKPILKAFGQYLLGLLMAFQRSSAGNTGYFLGEVSAGGWHHYFPIVFLIKEPLPSLILLIFTLILGSLKLIRSFSRKNLFDRLKNWLWQNFTKFTLLAFVIFYWLLSIASPLNIGLRHLLPTFPFLYILISLEIKKWWRGEDRHFFFNWRDKIKYYFQTTFNRLIKTVFLIIILLWYFLETLFIAPHFIAYFNELVGGAKNGYRYVVDSNLDWGQDLKRLKEFVEKNNIEKIKVDYFGGGSPAYYLKEKFEPYWSAKGEPEYNSWFAVSLTFLQGATGKPVAGFERKFEDSYWWLKDKEPFARIGYSIFVYKF